MTRALRPTLATLLLCLALPSLSAAKPLVGVQGISASESPTQASTELDAVKRAHMTAIRVQVFWAELQPRDGDSYDAAALSRLDATVDGAARRGLKVILFADGTPCWASAAPAADRGQCTGDTQRAVYRYGPADPQSFVALSVFLVKRYGARLGGYEIWNEPDQRNELYWAGSNKVARYVAMTKAVYGPLKAAAPQVPVLAGSFVGTDGAWLKALYQAGIKGYYDGLAVHFYDLPLYALHQTRAVQRQFGDTKPLWLTEFGWSSCYRPHGPALVLEHACLTRSGQATAVSDLIKAVRTTSWVKAAILYTMRDENTAYQFGLFDARGKLKPAYTTLRTLLAHPRGAVRAPRLRLTVSRGRLVVSGSASIPDLYTLRLSSRGQLRYAASIRTDRFGNFRLVLPRVLPRSHIVVSLRSTWSGRSAHVTR